jgi:LytR cell envelope-related transcriptional attenuator
VRARPQKPASAVEAPLPPDELIRPWRTATIVASLIAAVELVLLVAGGALLLARPLSHVLTRHAHAAAVAHTKKEKAKPAPAAKPHPKPRPVARPTLARSKTPVAVLNGNGRNGAAASEASKLHHLGYPISSTANARRQDYATSVVLYRPGFAAEGKRLARDLGVKVVGPLDGITAAALHGGKLAVIVGA